MAGNVAAIVVLTIVAALVFTGGALTGAALMNRNDDGGFDADQVKEMRAGAFESGVRCTILVVQEEGVKASAKTDCPVDSTPLDPLTQAMIIEKAKAKLAEINEKGESL